jgi:hypothetical protein
VERRAVVGESRERLRTDLTELVDEVGGCGVGAGAAGETSRELGRRQSLDVGA